MDLVFFKRKNSDLYFNEKYISGFVQEKKIQICILMKNTDLVFIRNKKNEVFIINFLQI